MTMALDRIATPTARSAELQPRGDIVVCGIRITNATKDEAVARMRELVHAMPERARSVYIVNAHSINLACDFRAYADVLNSADVVFGDGTGVRWAARLQKVRMRDNLVGTDLVPLFMQRTREDRLGYYLLGGRDETVAAASAHVIATFGVRMAGHHHGHFTPEESAAVIAEINAAAPDVLLVAMGNPFQEQWIHDNASRLRCKLAVGIGGLVDHWGGTLTRAPEWVRRNGIEWAQIMLQQPHKWRRYLLGNPKFLARVVRDLRTRG